MRKSLESLAATCLLIGLSACAPGDRGQADIYLPEGDVDRGREHFVALGCSGCHNVTGADLPEPAADQMRVLLGSRDLSYGQLVTSIVNPSHKLSPRYRSEQVSRDDESLMESYNDVITITQLTDLVAFLQAHYQTTERPGYTYPVYKYGDAE